jgi:hypothetical protein
VQAFQDPPLCSSTHLSYTSYAESLDYLCYPSYGESLH